MLKKKRQLTIKINLKFENEYNKFKQFVVKMEGGTFKGNLEIYIVEAFRFFINNSKLKKKDIIVNKTYKEMHEKLIKKMIKRKNKLVLEMEDTTNAVRKRCLDNEIKSLETFMEG